MATFSIQSTLTAPGTGEQTQVNISSDSKEGAYRLLSDRIRFQARAWGMDPRLIQQSNQFFGAFNEATQVEEAA